MTKHYIPKSRKYHYEHDSRLFKDSVSYRPWIYPWAVEMWDRHEDVHWVKEEAGIGSDVQDWTSGLMTPEEKEYTTQILRLFTQSDLNVGNFQLDYLIRLIRNNEVRVGLVGNTNREGTHQRAYGSVMDTLNLPEGEYTAFLKYKEMSDKHEFMLDASTDSLEDFILAICKSIGNEGVTLFGSFAMLLHFQVRQPAVMRGMCTVVEWSIRDENLHVEFLVHLLKTLLEDYPGIMDDELTEEVYGIFRTIAKLEDAFIDLAFGHSPIEGITPDEVKAFVRYLINQRLIQMGLAPIYPDHAENPLEWMTWVVQAEDHSNFFEKKSSEYAANGTSGVFVPYTEDLASVQICTMPGCGYCVKAKDLLDRDNIPYEETLIATRTARTLWFRENGFDDNQRTMPKIYATTKSGKSIFIGGADDLETYLANTFSHRVTDFESDL